MKDKLELCKQFADEIANESSRLTTGNLAHRKAVLTMSATELSKMLSELISMC